MKNQEKQNQKNEELQERAYELYQLNQHIQNVQSQAQILQNELIEIKKLLESLKEFGKSKKIFSHLGGGVFAKTMLEEDKKVLVNVGENVLVKKNAEEARELIGKQSKEIEKILGQMESNLQGWGQRASKLEAEMHDLDK